MRLLKTTKRTEEELRRRNEKRSARALTRWERLLANQDEEYPRHDQPPLPRPEPNNNDDQEEEQWSNNTTSPTTSTTTTTTTSRPSVKGKQMDNGSGSSSESSEESEERQQQQQHSRRGMFAARRQLQKKKKDRRSSHHRRSDHHSGSGSSGAQRPTPARSAMTPFDLSYYGAKRLQQLEQANAMKRFFDALGGRES